MNVLRWRPFVHLFDTPIQNSPYGQAEFLLFCILQNSDGTQRFTSNNQYIPALSRNAKKENRKKSIFGVISNHSCKRFLHNDHFLIS